MELLLATGNRKKVEEVELLLAPLGVRILRPADVGGIPDTLEDAPTFEGNAVKKAQEAARATRRWCLADDSGLEVDALDGAPGVHSARFAGTHGDDAANNALLLERLAGVSAEQRGARFVCVLALARPDGSLAGTYTGHAAGRILDAPRGDAGFGYDPLFQFMEEGLAATGRGFAELAPEDKGAVSHRGRALRAMAAELRELVEA